MTFDVHKVLLTVQNGSIYHYVRLARQYLDIQSVNISALKTNFFYSFRMLNEKHPGYGIHTNISSREWWKLLIEDTFKDYKISPTNLDKLSTIIYDEFAKGELWVKHSQADEVLKELRKTKSLGVISNFDERLESLLEQHGLRQYFQFVLTPRNCGLYKPQTEIFSYAAKLANIESHNNLCHIGDDVTLDYRAAQKANCQPVLLCNDEESRQQLLNEHKDIDENRVILHLNEILKLIA